MNNAKILKLQQKAKEYSAKFDEARLNIRDKNLRSYMLLAGLYYYTADALINNQTELVAKLEAIPEYFEKAIAAENCHDDSARFFNTGYAQLGLLISKYQMNELILQLESKTKLEEGDEEGLEEGVIWSFIYFANLATDFISNSSDDLNLIIELLPLDLFSAKCYIKFKDYIKKVKDSRIIIEKKNLLPSELLAINKNLVLFVFLLRDLIFELTYSFALASAYYEAKSKEAYFKVNARVNSAKAVWYIRISDYMRSIILLTNISEKPYLIIGEFPSSQLEDFSSCINKTKEIMKHLKHCNWLEFIVSGN